jgi:hypothetical protein
MQTSPLASTSVKRHYVRGALGLVGLVAAVVGAVVVTPAALALLIVTVGAWRGCPTCWAIGLMQTREGQRCQGVACRKAFGIGAIQTTVPTGTHQALPRTKGPT